MSRRRGVKSSATRAELIEAAAALIREEGYAALTSRTLADRLGLSRQIVHYYFKSIDELCIAVVQQRASRTLARLERAIESPEPLRAVWEICNDPAEASLSLELNALARRRPAVRAEVKNFAERFRDLQTDALSQYLLDRGIEPAIKPIVATVLLTCLSQILALEKAIDITRGHAETLQLADESLRAFAQGQAPPAQAEALLDAGHRRGRAKRKSARTPRSLRPLRR